MKPEIKFENGKIKAVAQAGLDKDQDGVQSVALKVELEIDAVEAITEIVKKDVPFLKDILAKLGV